MDPETKDMVMELAETASGAAELLRVLAASEVDGATRDALLLVCRSLLEAAERVRQL